MTHTIDTLMALADSYGNHRMTDGHHDLVEDHPHTLKARAKLHAALVEALTKDVHILYIPDQPTPRTAGCTLCGHCAATGEKIQAAQPVRVPLTVQEVEQILHQHDYELHGDRARYIVSMTEQAHQIGGDV